MCKESDTTERLNSTEKSGTLSEAEGLLALKHQNIYTNPLH